MARDRRGHQSRRRQHDTKKRLWLDEWAWALVELGLTSDEYWALTPAEFSALARAWQTKMKREGYKVIGSPQEQRMRALFEERAAAAHLAALAASQKVAKEASRG